MLSNNLPTRERYFKHSGLRPNLNIFTSQKKFMKKLLYFITIPLCFAACQNNASPVNDAGGASANETSTKPEKLKGTLEQVWETDTILTTNESVFYNELDGLFYVSCINGQPLDDDKNGFIAQLKPNGQIAELEWAQGLSAPKGMGQLNGKLYVTDIDRLVAISLEDPSSQESYPVEGAQFLNDVAVLNGVGYFTDMQTCKIHQLKNNQVETLRTGHESINGLAVADGKLYALDGKGLHEIPLDGAAPKTLNSTLTGGDGLIHISDSTFVASRWQGEIWLLRGKESFKMLDSKENKIQTADIGYLPEKQLLLVPRFFSNKVTAMRLNY
jgi:hypothetical protein